MYMTMQNLALVSIKLYNPNLARTELSLQFTAAQAQPGPPSYGPYKKHKFAVRWQSKSVAPTDSL
jgi:hypothetical protein